MAAKKPDIIIGSWRGKKFHPDKVGQRDGWQNVPEVINNDVYEIKSAFILQSGDGLDQVFAITTEWQKQHGWHY